MHSWKSLLLGLALKREILLKDPFIKIFTITEYSLFKSFIIRLIKPYSYTLPDFSKSIRVGPLKKTSMGGINYAMNIYINTEANLSIAF